MSSCQVNGDARAAHCSAFLQHLLDYPVISDGIRAFKSGDYGWKSIQLSDAAYKTFAALVIPWFQKPCQFVSPYVQNVDSLGDKSLHYVDKRFPLVKKPTEELYNDTKGLILLPYHKGLEGKEHVI
ncbi:hypothetical protein NW754_007762 [Fusarium falciforme]|uniref:Uncharacterized protein n=1 Tax=Fusarium falciforme TaxID=195108 RepID=A0A9W8UUP4_9HYPO|nr:hypothetical protein NW754_007762 [Fusarium falciforme]KAJ4177140.1 hypothetical protein NW755_014019 [Fusarium falciforme]KAJ4179228.1 hypothetical protein NW767_014662 [Fusarium falciforme]KAJ4230188.1 hypothetical protein NW757_013988 [Fusarium falciforme]